MADAQRADQLSREGRWDDAVALYRKALKTDPYNKDLQTEFERARSQAAKEHYRQGRMHLQHGVPTEALAELKIALSLDPTKPEYKIAFSDAMRFKHAREKLLAGHKFQNLGRTDDAIASFERAVELDPNLTEALSAITTATDHKHQAESFRPGKPITLRFQNAKLREVFEILARTAGLNVIFDREVRDEPITIFIKDMSFDDALNMILNTNGLTAHHINAETLLILPSTKQKQYQDLVIRTFYLSNAKAKEAINVLRTIVESKRMHVDEKVNAIVMRDEPAKVHLAERILYSIDRQDPEVELDLEVLEVDRTKSLKYGLNFAKTAGAGIVPPGFTGSLTTNPTQFFYEQLTNLGPQSYLFTFPASVLLDFFKQESDAKTLAAPRLRVLNNRPASIMVGDKQPILLSTTNTLPGQAATGAVPTTSTVTSIEFKDVGVKLTVEPTVHLDDELTLKLKVEVTRLGDQITLQANPEIKQFRFGTRTAETVLMIKDDETVILAGLLQDEERRTKNKIPWLDFIPFLDKIFSSTTEDTVTTEVVLSITPHLVRRMTPPSIEGQVYWSGTDNMYATSPLFLPRTYPVSQSRTADVPRPPTSDEAMPVQPASGATKQGSILALSPMALSTTVGEELIVSIGASRLQSGEDSLVSLSYDQNALQFLRTVSGIAGVGTTALPGQVSLTIHPAGQPVAPNDALANVVFRAKTPGTYSILLQATAQAESGATTVASGAGTTLVHVK